MSKLVTIYGGSGFVGRYIVQRLARQGWRIRVAVRRPNEALFLKSYGAVGQVEPVLCNIRDDQSVASALSGADVVVNCVGTFDLRGKNNMSAVQAEGAGRIARLAAAAGVERMAHISAIGADAHSDSAYAQSKAAGETAVLQHMPEAIILRPSVIFGTEDGLFNLFASIAKWTFFVPLIGGKTRFQPVAVTDVATAAELAVTGQAKAGIYELGGPDIVSMRQLQQDIFDVIRRKRVLVPVPLWFASFQGWAFEWVERLSGGLFPAMLTRDQVKMLRSDNVVSETAQSLSDLGITPVGYKAIIPQYLWRFRPSGQYDAIKESAENLRR